MFYSYGGFCPRTIVLLLMYFVIFQLFSIVNGVLRLELMEYPDRGRQISINRQLISRGFADEAEENFLSKVINVQLNLVIQGYLHTIKHCYQW